MAFNKYPKIVMSYIDDYDYVSVNETGNKVYIDMHDGDEKKYHSPTELLLTAVASCAAVDVVEIIKKRKRSFTDLQVEVDSVRRDEHPRAITHMQIHFKLVSDTVTEKELLKHAKLVVEKYCTVATTVSAYSDLEVVATVSPE